MERQGDAREDARETGTLVPEDTLRPFPLEVKRGDETQNCKHTHTQGGSPGPALTAQSSTYTGSAQSPGALAAPTNTPRPSAANFLVTNHDPLASCRRVQRRAAGSGVK